MVAKMTGGVREKYLEALGVKEEAAERAKLQAALTRAHEIRKFEIDLYWKRATYFWALEVAVFAAFGLLWKDHDTRLLALPFAGLGVVAGYAAWLSSLGSKFWQENWEKHIDLLEGEFEGHLHKTILIGPRGVKFSVSRVNERLNLILFLFWCIVLVVSVGLVFEVPRQLSPWLFAIAGLIAIVVALGSLYRTRSDLKGKIYAEGVTDNCAPLPRGKKNIILRRCGPAGEA